MKRVIALSLAALLAGTTVASAGSYRGWSRGHHNGWSHHRGGNDAALGIGLGVLALGALAVISSQNNRSDAYYSGPAYPAYNGPAYDGPDPYYDRYDYPPGAYDGRGYDNGAYDNGGYYSSPYDNGPGYPAYDDDDYGD
ncbi:MAG: hypothetical protein J0H10_03285 [Alphaproteobacteria bacterium]|jgi:hypothetical protein|nr:hypothetical protein [Alphaproteobacteria bacterium]